VCQGENSGELRQNALKRKKAVKNPQKKDSGRRGSERFIQGRGKLPEKGRASKKGPRGRKMEGKSTRRRKRGGTRYEHVERKTEKEKTTRNPSGGEEERKGRKQNGGTSRYSASNATNTQCLGEAKKKKKSNIRKKRGKGGKF